MQITSNRSLTFTGTKETRTKAAERTLDILERKQVLTPEETRYTKNCVIYPIVVDMLNGKPATLKRLSNADKVPVYEIFIVKSRDIVDKVVNYYKTKGRLR